MSTSLIYRSAAGYELVMRALYGRHYRARMRAVAEQVPEGSTVLELCCGPGTLYTRHLRSRVSGYTGLDLNPRFVARLTEAGVNARQVDLTSPLQELPDAEVVVMQASLYHFLPHAGALVDRMLAAASDRVIISEPVRNLASSDMAIVRLLGRSATDPGAGEHAQRFTERTLDQLMDRYRERVITAEPIPGGREKLYVLSAG